MQTSIGQPAAFAEGRFPSGRAESASAPNNPSSGSTNSAAVTANDFLQLLVTEMKNQDPTANTDPNEYINQLVQVNSLQQLIEINEDLGGGSSGSPSGHSASPGWTPANAVNAAAENSAAPNSGIRGTRSGNLPVPASSAAATRVAQALQLPATGSPYAALQNLVHAQGRTGGTVSNTINMAR